MTSTFLILTGVHSAGKTTVGADLRDRGIPCERELAQVFVEEGRYEFTTESSTTFQESLFQAERERDRELLAEGRDTAIISWHVAELAHAREKASGDLVERQRTHVERLLAEEDLDLHGVHLSVSNEEMLRRSESVDGNEDAVSEYYDAVREHIDDIYGEFGVDYRVVENERGELQRTCERVATIARDVL